MTRVPAMTGLPIIIAGLDVIRSFCTSGVRIMNVPISTVALAIANAYPDPGDTFLGSDLTYGDIEDRSTDADSYELIEKKEGPTSSEYLVRIKPKEENALYSKKESLYVKTNGWTGCIRAKTNYYDRQGNLLKKQKLTWQSVADAWVWDEVTVENVQTMHKSKFTITNVKVNTGLKDRLFTERALKKGM